MRTILKLLLSACLVWMAAGASAQACNAEFTYQGTGPTVYFINNSSVTPNANAYYYTWNFGDGSALSHDTNVVHAYTTGGVYTVCLYLNAFYNGAVVCSDTFCQAIAVTVPVNCGNVHADFTATQSGSSVVLNSTSTGTNANTLYEWWMDGQPITNPTPNTSYTVGVVLVGNHVFCLHVWGNANTFCDSTCHNFFMPSGNPCANVNANFIYTLGGNHLEVNAGNNYPSGTSFQWWLDGQATAIAPTYLTYSWQNLAPGVHTVCLYAYGNNSTTFCDSMCQTVTVTTCNINAGFQTTNGVSGTTFWGATNNPTGTTYTWLFGDGHDAVTTVPTTTHAYPATPNTTTYNACLIAAVPGTTCRDTFCQAVVVPGVSCHAYFVATATSQGLAAFTNSSSAPGDTITSYYWTFGDNTSSTVPNPTHQYNTASGTYIVCLAISTVHGCTSSYCDTVHYGGCQLNAGFQYTTAGAGTIFTANVNQGATYHWNFGDGSDATTSSPSFTHQYPQLSTISSYYACLIVSIPGTVCRDTFCQTVVIPASTVNNCHANFGWTFNGTTAVFTNTSTPTAGTISTWSFGDGSSSTAFAPTHSYNSPGTYLVCLSISNNGCTSQHCDSIHVGTNTGPCQAHFTATPVNCNTLHFNNISTGSFTGVKWYFGDGDTSDAFSPNHTYTLPGGAWTVLVILTGPNCQSSFYDVVTVPGCGGNDTICGIVFNDTNNNGHLDSTETGIAGAEVHAGNYTAVADANGHYQFVVPAGGYHVYYTSTTGCIYTLPLNSGSNTNSGYYIQGATGGVYCGYNFGVNCNIVHVCGMVYFDANNNGVRDSAEAGVPNIPVLLTGSNSTVHHAYTNQNGEYCETLPAGTYTVTLGSNNYQTCTVTPAAASVAATTAGQFYPGNNFAINCPPGQCNLAITITPHTTVTAGFPAWYDIQVCNVGVNPTNGTVNMFYDPSLTFNSASPVQSGYNSSTQTLSWALSTLAPGACTSIWVQFNANTNIQLNQFVFTLVNVNPGTNCNDVNLTNNVDTLHQNVTGSWDPNNKLAFNTNYDDPAYQLVSSVEPDQRIEYVVNFQNTGNAPAINVVVDDVISADLDINSFELLGSSHPCLVTRNGSQLNFKFSNIMLPAEATDEPNSHGYIKFAVNAVNGLAGGHVISDEADIYFDYNAPVTTNDASVTLLEPTGIEEVQATTIVIAPNPMNEYTQVMVKGQALDNLKLTVTDLTGRIVSEQQANGNTILLYRNNLAAGIYTYRLTSNNKPVAQGKLVMQ